MNSETQPRPDQSVGVPALTNAAGMPTPYWPGASLGLDAGESSGPNVATYLHAFRRRSGLAVTLGVLCAIGAAAAVYVAVQPKYTSESLLRVASQEKQLVFETADRATESKFEVYKNTQSQLVTSRFVLTAALRNPEISQLSIIAEEVDPVKWLQGKIRVRFPGDGEIMSVSAQTGDGEQTAQIVNEVVTAYLNEVVDVERNERMGRLSSLDQVYASTESEVRKKQESLKGLADRLNTLDQDALSLKQQLAIEQFGAFRRELVNLRFELRQRERDLKLAETFRDAEEGPALPRAAIEAALESDPIARDLYQSLAMSRLILADMGDKFVPELAAGYENRVTDQMAGLQEQLKLREEEIRERVNAAAEQEVYRLENEVALLREEVTELTGVVEEKQVDVEELGGSSVEVLMMRAEVEHLEGVRSKIGDERERLKVELRTGSRVTLLQPAEAPQTADSNNRLQMMAAMSMIAFLVPVVGVSFWESRHRRVATPQEVRAIPGMELMGSLPLLPSSAMRHTDRVSSRQQRWQTHLRESADATTAMLMRKARVVDARVILVSSALEREAKTTLATQLALSLARNGSKTILVDANLRSPALNDTFGLEEVPGLSEVLRGEVELRDAVRESGFGDLSLLTAGEWNVEQQPLLANGAVGALFRELREEYDFVLVDSGPILPVADTRLLSQHVDGVVLSVLRDVSRLPTISASHAILSALGTRVLGVVVTGSVTDIETGSLTSHPHRAA